MQKHLFEYAVIRIVPRVFREEFVNVGVVLYSKKEKFLAARFTVDDNRILAVDSAADLEEIRDHLQAYQKIVEGEKTAGPIAQLDIASRFRWLTATRSTVIQSSKIHPGFCSDLPVALEKLHRQLVL